MSSTDAEKLISAFLEKTTKEIGDLAKAPAWVKHCLSLMRRPTEDPIYNGLGPLISVQPMTSPVGGIAYYKPRYGKQEPCIVDALGKLADAEPVKNPYDKEKNK